MIRKLQFVAVLATVFMASAIFSPVAIDAAIISPPLNDEVYEAGKSYPGQFTVFFTEEDPDILYLSMAKLEINDITGSKRAISVDPNENTLANWVGLDRLIVEKPPGATFENSDNAVVINYVVDVPADAPPGGTYAVAIISSKPSDDVVDGETGEIDTGLGVGADLTYQFLAQIEGEIRYQTALMDFRTVENQWLFPHLPVQFETVFENGGNVHVIPRGNIEIFQGGKIANISMNPGQLRVFPGKTRLYENVWSEEGIENMEDQVQIDEAYANMPESFFEHVLYEIQNFRIGQYTASLQGFAGNQPPYGDEVTFWVIPWHLLIVIVVALVVLFIVWRMRRRMKGAEYVSTKSSKYKTARKSK